MVNYIGHRATKAEEKAVSNLSPEEKRLREDLLNAEHNGDIVALRRAVHGMLRFGDKGDGPFHTGRGDGLITPTEYERLVKHFTGHFSDCQKAFTKTFPPEGIKISDLTEKEIALFEAKPKKPHELPKQERLAGLANGKN